MKCAEMVRTSQNGPFFIKSMFLPQCLLWLQYTCCGEGPGEQPGMAKSLVREWYHKAIHPCFNLLNDLLYQLHENSRRPAAAAFIFKCYGF